MEKGEKGRERGCLNFTESSGEKTKSKTQHLEKNIKKISKYGLRV